MTETVTADPIPYSNPATTTEPLPRIRDPRLLLLIRLVWVVFALAAVAVTIVSIPAYIQTCNCAPNIVAEWERLGIGQGVRLVFTVLTAINMLILLALSALIVWRRPDDSIAIYVALAALVQGVYLVAGPTASSANWYQAIRHIDNFLMPLSWLGLFFLFPNGRFFPAWTRYVVMATVALHLFDVALPESSGLRRPTDTVLSVWTTASMIIGLWAIRRRYLSITSAVQRQQIKYTVYALGITLLILMIALPVQSLIKDITALAYYVIFRHILLAVAQTFIPATIAFAILRYRLWNIDLAINRAIVSALVTLGLAALFVLEFSAAQAILSRVFGGDNDLIDVAIPAALTALAFNPARKWVRNQVDRRLYGFRFDLNELAAAQKDEPITNPGLLSGRTLGSYKLLDVIGRGGMGEVYKSFGDGHPAAIKILPKELASQPEPRARFEREAQTLTTLTHPNIVKFYDYGASDDLQYLVMELVEGEELGTRLKRERRISLDDTRAILDDLAAALDYAHERGFIHRDIKPSNVMLTPGSDTSGQRAVLMDFGIAKIENARTSITGSGAIGTIDYMSPEQIMESRQVDARTDIYALGVMLYEMLTGELPFKGSAGQMLFAHLQQPAPDPRIVMPDLPPAIARALLKALAKNPDDRFQSAGDLADAFAEPVAAASVA